MAMTPEKKVKQTIAKVLKEMGAYYFFPATGGYGRSGVPDIVGCYEGKFFGIECKAGNNTTTALVNEDNVATFKEVLQKSKGRTETPGLLDELED